MGSKFEGYIDAFQDGIIYGWARRDDGTSVTIEILVDENIVEILEAREYREDLATAGIGTGEYAFISKDLRSLLDDDRIHVIDARIRNTEIRVSNGPIFFKGGKSLDLKCFAPWTSLSVTYQGVAHVCPCQSLLKEPHVYLGDTKTQTLLEIWNSPSVIEYRNSFKKGDYTATCREELCPYLADTYAQERPASNVIRSILEDAEILDYGPEVLTHDIDLGCNLECVMCRSEKIKVDRVSTARAVAQIKDLASTGGLRKVITSGAGEALLFKDFVELLSGPTLSDQDVEVHINTNLTTFNDKIWNKIKHNKLSFLASIDGATKETYEKIRIGASWEKAYAGLQSLAKLYNDGEISLVVSFIIMGANKHEVGDIIKLCRYLNIPMTFSSHYYFSTIEENIFDCCDLESLDFVYDQFIDAGGFEIPSVTLGSADLIKNRAYRSVDFRLGRARYQMTNQKRYDLAERILRQAIQDVMSDQVECTSLQEAELRSALSQTVAMQ